MATRTLLDVAKREHVWEGGFEPGSQIRLSVPEPRGEIVDTAAADDNYAVLVDGELRAGSQLLTEQVTINGTTFDYQVDANGFWASASPSADCPWYARDQSGQRAAAVSGGRRNLGSVFRVPACSPCRWPQ